MLGNPIDAIIKPGGAILLAKTNNEIVGTCALIFHDNHEFELAKMAVSDEYQGRQIGKKLGIATLDKARTLNAKKIFLESNKKLTPALNLYEKLGFKISRNNTKESVYERCNICMEIELS